MRSCLRQLTAGVLCVGGLVWASDASADASAMEEVLGILRSEGVINDAEKERLTAKYASEQSRASEDAADLLGGFQWYGDLRLRYEAFRYDDDALGVDRDNRNRFRYRARLGFKKSINDYVDAGVRIVSGGGDRDSTNTTFGNNGFEADGIFFDRAWIDLTLADEGGMGLNLVGGRVSNPYTWKNGKDPLIWDGDINLTGAHLSSSFTPNEDTELFATLGAFIADENSTSADPKVLGGQVGFTTGIFGIRASLYDYRSLDDDFIEVGTSQGNLVGPSGDDDGAFDDGKARVAELSTFVNVVPGAFPVMLFGSYVRNLTADGFAFVDPDSAAVFSVDDEDTAWGLGIQAGDKKKNVQVGIAYYHLEANSVIAQFTDSDLFDGLTNREGFVVYASRQVAKNTDFKLTLFSGEEIEDTGAILGVSEGPFTDSIGDADRLRLQADIVVKM